MTTPRAGTPDCSQLGLPTTTVCPEPDAHGDRSWDLASHPRSAGAAQALIGHSGAVVGDAVGVSRSRPMPHPAGRTRTRRRPRSQRRGGSCRLARSYAAWVERLWDERALDGIAAWATSICEMGATANEFRATMLEQLERIGMVDPEFIRAAAARIALLPQPADESAEEIERSRPVREMLGVTSAAAQLEASLRAREWLGDLADEVGRLT